MKKGRSFLYILGIVIFSIGLVLGTALIASATWGDVEATLYGFTSYGYRNGNIMHCPIIMTSGETSTITATVKNPLDRAIRPNVRLTISPLYVRTERVPIDAGESREYSWDVSSSDIGLRNYVLVQIMKYSSYPLPNLEQTCGILVLGITFLKGSQIVWIFLIGSLAFMAIGFVIWFLQNRVVTEKSADITRALIIFSLIVIIGFVSIFMALWPLGMITTAVTILMIGVILGSLIQDR